MSTSPAVIPCAPVPTTTPDIAHVPVDTSASSKGVVGPQSSDQMIRNGNFDSRATAQLILFKNLLEKRNMPTPLSVL
jgi:hypothetical protein